jgi:hypothetical protein
MPSPSIDITAYEQEFLELQKNQEEILSRDLILDSNIVKELQFEEEEEEEEPTSLVTESFAKSTQLPNSYYSTTTNNSQHQGFKLSLEDRKEQVFDWSILFFLTLVTVLLTLWVVYWIDNQKKLK